VSNASFIIIALKKGGENMEITVAVVVMAITLLLGEITKLTVIPNKYIPLQNIIIAILSSAVCLIFEVEGLGVLETILTCIFASMSAGGIADIKKIAKSE
jgi:hypothetical protein